MTYEDVVTTSSRRRSTTSSGRRDDDVRRRRTYITGFSVTFLCKYLCLSYTLLLYRERVHIRCFTYLLAYLATLKPVIYWFEYIILNTRTSYEYVVRPVRRRHVVIVRRRDDDVGYDDVVTTSTTTS